MLTPLPLNLIYTGFIVNGVKLHANKLNEKSKNTPQSKMQEVSATEAIDIPKRTYVLWVIIRDF